MAGTLYVVATPIGNLEDMSHRAVRILGEVDIIAAEDTRSAGVLLGHYGIGGASVKSYFEGNEAARSAELVAALQDGKSVAVISEAGTPAVSDPGQRLVAAAAEAGIRVEVIPGPSAAIAALVGSGLPTREFRFVGFPPREAGARRQLFGRLAGDPATLVLYEAPDRVAATLGDLVDAFGADRRVSLGRELTKKFEEHVRGTLAELLSRYADTPPRGECTLVVEGGQGAVDIDIEAEMRALLDQGLGPKDAAQRLVVKTGKKRRELYQLALALGRERD
ncbi:MAG: 16S rRNA (cytidine(1402)-2'-O)-methyltransferase [Deltaproteobacteria bacterium]|nr:16S rRNA (cytidine(1402)-2'-O)-methyltransferase [Deltaproteobacteria bacterium]